MGAALDEQEVTPQTPWHGSVMELYREAFPPCERFDEALLNQMAQHPQVRFVAYFEAQRLCGFSLSAVTDSFLYILFLAVESQMRGTGCGSRILSQLHERHPQLVHVLEIEPLEEDTSNYNQRVRRLRFYQRNGFAPAGYDLYENDMRYTVLYRPADGTSNASFDANAFARELREVSGGIYSFDLRPTSTSER